MEKLRPYFIIILHILALLALQQLSGIISTDYAMYAAVFQIVLILYAYFFIKKVNFKTFLIAYFLFMVLLHVILKFNIVFYFLITQAVITLLLSQKLSSKFLSIKNFGIMLFVSGLAYLSLGYIYPQTKEYFNYKNAYKNIPEKLQLSITNKSDENIIFEKEKVYVLDLWTTTCGVCIQQFPDFYATSQRFKNHANVHFSYVLVKDPKEPSERYKKLLDQQKYPLDLWFVPSIAEAKNANILQYPTLLIIKNGQIIYQGHVSYDKHSRYNHIDELINEQL